VKLLDRALALDPRTAEDRGLRFAYPRCLMRAGRCDEGTKRQRELLASEDGRRLKSDAALDVEARSVSDQECPSSTAKNDVDFVLRAARELSASAQAKDPAECKASFEKVFARMKSADEQWKAARKGNEPLPSQAP
jgi:hypothetical protein